MWPVVVLTKAVPFSLFSLLWRVVFNTFVFVCTESILNSNHKTALNESPCLPLPVTVVSKSDTISTPLEGGCPFFFFRDTSFRLKCSGRPTSFFFFIQIISEPTQKLTLLLSLVAHRFFNLLPLPCAWDVQSWEMTEWQPGLGIIGDFVCTRLLRRKLHANLNDVSSWQTVTSQMRVS